MYWPVVKVIVLVRILNQLMLQIATSNSYMDWQKYPKSRKAIRIKQPRTLESKECPTFPEMGDGLCEAFVSNLIYLFKGFKNEQPAHVNAVKASRRRSRKLRRPPKLFCLLARQSDSELTWHGGQGHKY
jgi:hypothetical protein